MSKGKQITIYVTPKDIREGQTCASKTCPVARAFARAFARYFPKRKLADWGIGDHYARIGITRFIFPFRVTNWIKHFDGCDCGRPFRFTLTLPS